MLATKKYEPKEEIKYPGRGLTPIQERVLFSYKKMNVPFAKLPYSAEFDEICGMVFPYTDLDSVRHSVYNTLSLLNLRGFCGLYSPKG